MSEKGRMTEGNIVRKRCVGFKRMPSFIYNGLWCIFCSLTHLPPHLFETLSPLYCHTICFIKSLIWRQVCCKANAEHNRPTVILKKNQNSESKTEIIIFRSSSSNSASKLDLGPLTPYVKSMVTNLGVKLDSDFNLEKQINSVVKASFFQLRQITKLKPFLSFKDLERVIHAFITNPPGLL